MDENSGLLAVSAAPDFTTDAQVMEVIHAACVKLKMPELFPRIKLSWAKKCSGHKRWIGSAHYASMTITLSTVYWPLLKPSQRLDTIRHEVCHLVCRARYGVKAKAHGKEWRLLCVVVGCNPRAREQEGIEGIEKVLPVHRRVKHVFCGCGPRTMSTVKYNRMLSGYGYSCPKCKRNISTKPLETAVKPFTPPVVQAPAAPLPQPVKMSANDLGLLKVGTVVYGFYGEKAFKYIKLNGGWVPMGDLNAKPMTNGFFAQMPQAFAIAT